MGKGPELQCFDNNNKNNKKVLKEPRDVQITARNVYAQTHALSQLLLLDYKYKVVSNDILHLKYFTVVALSEHNLFTVILSNVCGGVLNLHKKDLMKGIYEFKNQRTNNNPISTKCKPKKNPVTVDIKAVGFRKVFQERSFPGSSSNSRCTVNQKLKL